MPFTTADLQSLGYVQQPDGSFTHSACLCNKPTNDKPTQPKNQNRNPRTSPKLERNPCNEPLGQNEIQEYPGQKFLVRVTAIRKRLLDEDNLCEKYHVDLCRYAGIISGDEAGKTKIETCQRKAKKGEPESTIIEIELIPAGGCAST
jgi:hypothetical protein